MIELSPYDLILWVDEDTGLLNQFAHVTHQNYKDVIIAGHYLVEDKSRTHDWDAESRSWVELPTE